ncbi:hypothetical protein LMG26788_02015 [Achromobacter pulmonis]|uniref:Uncharacterized protein n=1 Tax=Achromobacter pulmonis TaxID=1389932 RepID=A0A6S7DWQ3_9BURK|nr:hypothetical protein LMG26788_02015 [Achromobacter pulmonis]
MKALVIQFSATGLPPSSRAIEGSAMAGPVNVNGMAAHARHTATRIRTLRAVGSGGEAEDDMAGINAKWKQH